MKVKGKGRVKVCVMDERGRESTGEDEVLCVYVLEKERELYLVCNLLLFKLCLFFCISLPLSPM